MTYQTEFPDFPAADMPTIPDGFVDTSWRNDACPCFVSDRFTLWIDYADPTKREFEGYRRFEIASQRDGIEITGPSLATDDWNEILTFLQTQNGDQSCSTN